MEQVKKFTMLVGLNDKDTKKRKINRNKAKEVIMSIVGDCTISDAVGHYTHEDGTVVNEKCLRVELLFKADNEVISYCHAIKRELNQESIALSYTYENSMLV